MATDVALEPNLVIAVADLQPLKVTLVAADGTEIAAEPTENPRLDHVQSCVNAFWFFRPATRLAANTTYSVRIDVAGDSDPSSSFTTGEVIAELTPTALPSLRYHRLLAPEGCSPEDPYCSDFIGLEEADVPSGAPTFLKISGKAPSTDPVVYELAVREFNYAPPSLIDLQKVSPADACLDYTWIDRSGATLQTGTLCDPKKCARASPTTLLETRSSCSLYYLDMAAWDALPDNNCDDPPVLPTRWASDAGIGDAEAPDASHVVDAKVTPTRDAGPDRSPTASESTGMCSVRVAAPRSSMFGGGWLALLAAVLWRARARTRVAAGGRSGGRPGRSSRCCGAR
ncbi:MAG: hypothetical protein QM778_20990 [Myxococcales bacterium]